MNMKKTEANSSPQTDENFKDETNGFHQMKLSSSMRETLKDMNYFQPSPIQSKAIPLLLGTKTDFIGLAATGTGKTAAYGIPLIENIGPTELSAKRDASSALPLGLILCPTRELAIQVTEQLSLLGKKQNLNVISLYGGAPYGEQLKGLKRGPQVVVGTPGRVIDHMKRKTLSLENVHTLILDEADKMVSMGFKEELEIILNQLTKNKVNIWLFSATLDKIVRKVVGKYLMNPKTVHINQNEILSKTVKQIFYKSKEKNKLDILCKLIDAASDEFYGIVFCQTKVAVSDVSTRLIEKKYKVESLHGDKDQKTREKILNLFKTKKIRILVCTDVASRGLDIKDVTHVVNYSLPEAPEVYVHRIGRTARYGKEGTAMTLVAPHQINFLKRLEFVTKSSITEGKIPSQREIALEKTKDIMIKFDSLTEYERSIDSLSSEWKDRIESMNPLEIAGRFLFLYNPEVYKKHIS